jgi:hypothetical protein
MLTSRSLLHMYELDARLAALSDHRRAARNAVVHSQKAADRVAFRLEAMKERTCCSLGNTSAGGHTLEVHPPIQTQPNSHSADLAIAATKCPSSTHDWLHSALTVVRSEMQSCTHRGSRSCRIPPLNGCPSPHEICRHRVTSTPD